MQEYSKKITVILSNHRYPKGDLTAFTLLLKLSPPVIFLIKKHFLSLISDLLILCCLFLFDFLQLFINAIRVPSKHNALTS